MKTNLSHNRPSHVFFFKKQVDYLPLKKYQNLFGATKSIIISAITIGGNSKKNIYKKLKLEGTNLQNIPIID